MDFKGWIDLVGGPAKAAAILEQKERTVKSWYDGEREPRPRTAISIVSKTHGVIDFEGIYKSPEVPQC